MKINQSANVEGRVEQIRSPKTGQDPDSVRAAAQAKSGASAQVNPAASVEINRAAVEALKGLDQTSDMELLRELRSRIESGNFQIDVDKTAEAILINAIAQSQPKMSSE